MAYLTSCGKFFADGSDGREHELTCGDCISRCERGDNIVASLTLTLGERQALDWVGNRYATGDDLYKHLWVYCEQSDDEQDWDDPRPMTFLFNQDNLDETYRICGEEDFLYPCFAPALVQKFEDLLQPLAEAAFERSHNMEQFYFEQEMMEMATNGCEAPEELE